MAIRERHESYDRASVTVVVVPLDADRSEGLRRPTAAGPAARAGALARGAGLGARTAGACSSPPPTGAAARCSRADPDAGAVTRLTTDHGAYSCLCPSPDGRFVYALRSAMDSPPLVVRIDAARPGEPEFLPGPAARRRCPAG